MVSTIWLLVRRGIRQPLGPVLSKRTLSRISSRAQDLLCSCACGRSSVSPQFVVTNTRSLFGFSSSESFTSKSKEYSEKRLIGYSKEQLYHVVANVDDYKYFVPWCRYSHVFDATENHARADIEVGFGPLSERYTSVMTLVRPNLVKSDCMDGSLFNYLNCVWKLSNGVPEIANSCWLDFYVAFEFKSLFHSQLSTMFFDEVVKNMVKAFETRCTTLYGPSSLLHTEYDPRCRRRKEARRRSTPTPTDSGAR